MNCEPRLNVTFYAVAGEFLMVCEQVLAKRERRKPSEDVSRRSSRKRQKTEVIVKGEPLVDFRNSFLLILFRSKS